MANHVYFNIELDCNISEAVTVQTIERKMWGNDSTYEVQELVEAHEFPMYAHLGYDDSCWYDWYCTNVGAKWINFDDFDLDAGYISGYSAWCAPVAFVEQLVTFLSHKLNRPIVASMTYEDEFRNFFGNDYFEGHYNEDDKEWYTDHHEDYRDHSDLIDILRDKFGDKVDGEDFDWWDLDEETDLVPQEYADDVVYNFFETGELTGD